MEATYLRIKHFEYIFSIISSHKLNKSFYCTKETIRNVDDLTVLATATSRVIKSELGNQMENILRNKNPYFNNQFFYINQITPIAKQLSHFPVQEYETKHFKL